MMQTLRALAGRLSACLLLWAGLSHVAVAQPSQPTTSAPALLDADRLALARARAQIWQQLRRLPFEEGTLGGWMVREPAIERGLRRWLAALPGGPMRIFSDGSRELTLVIRPDELRAQLNALRTERTAAALEAEARRPVGVAGETSADVAARRWPTLAVVGEAFPNELLATAAPGWENVNARGLDTARNAARHDALHNLAVAAAALKVTNARRLGDVLTPADRAQLLEKLRSVAEVSATLDANQIATAQARISLKDLIRAATEITASGGKREISDFREMALLNEATELTARGMAAPPSRDVSLAYAPPDRPVPEWAAEALVATGRWTPDTGPRLSAESAAARARQAALDELRRQVEAFLVRVNPRAAEIVLTQARQRDDLLLYIGAARVASEPPPAPDGSVEIRLELPLRRLWHILTRAERASAPLPAPSNDSPGERE